MGVKLGLCIRLHLSVHYCNFSCYDAAEWQKGKSLLIFNIPGFQLRSQDSAFNAKSSKSELAVAARHSFLFFFHSSEERDSY